MFESCSLSIVGGRLCYHIMYCSWLSTLVRVSVQPFGKFSHCSSMWTKTSVEFPITWQGGGGGGNSLIRNEATWLLLESSSVLYITPILKSVHTNLLTVAKPNSQMWHRWATPFSKQGGKFCILHPAFSSALALCFHLKHVCLRWTIAFGSFCIFSK